MNSFIYLSTITYFLKINAEKFANSRKYLYKA